MPRERRSWPSAQASICETTVFADEFDVFNPNNDKYLCLCGHVHCVTGVRLVICLLVLTLIVEFYQLCVAIVYQRSNKFAVGFIRSFKIAQLPVSTCINLLLGGFLTTCLMISLRYAKAVFLLPYLVMQASGLVSTTIFTVAFLYMAIYKDRKMAENFGVHSKKDESINASLWLGTGTFLVMSAIQIWLISVVIGCWRYLRDLSRPHLAIDEEAADVVMHGLRRSASAEIVERPCKERAGRSVSVTMDKSNV